jgi:hypothetical protein
MELDKQPYDEAIFFSVEDRAEVAEAAEAASAQVYGMHTENHQGAVDSAVEAGIGALPYELEQEAEAAEPAEAA